MSLSSFFSTFLSTTYADAPAEQEPKEESKDEESKDEEPKEESDGEESKDEPAAEEEEEEEPEDILPALREECAQSSKCAPLTKHFQHCQEKVEAGQGFKHEDCIEELCECLLPTFVSRDADHMYLLPLSMFSPMHCIDGCVAPKLFSKLV